MSQVKVIPAAPHSFHLLTFKMPSPQVNARWHLPTAKYAYSFFPESPTIVAGVKSKNRRQHLWCRSHEYVWWYIWFNPEHGLWFDGGISLIFHFHFHLYRHRKKSDDLKAPRNSSRPSATQRAPDIPHNCPPSTMCAYMAYKVFMGSKSASAFDLHVLLICKQFFVWVVCFRNNPIFQSVYHN